ncbi:MAG: Holliday junction branch migration protein RuvA [Bacteroidetes bacterium]|nr:Holliday junction branch migration protein RuvA [Bacteroidota bacterium]
MITYLNGLLTKKSPTEVIIETAGIGYSVQISLSTYEQLPELNASVQLLTHHHIREDAQMLYGFFTEHEREIFRMLLGVSGIGPKMAQTILSGIRPDELARTITVGAISSLTAIPGVGKKTAERMVLELKDKVAKMEGAEKIIDLPNTGASVRSEALTALVSLGFSREKAEHSLRSVLNELNGNTITVEELIKRALQHTSK